MHKCLNYCTLFNKSYLSRGIVLYKSLEEHCENFMLYVFAFDKETEEELLAANNSNMVVVSYEQFENEILKEAKTNRTPREFFWTCGCHTIKYVLENYEVDHCTYIDADMYFYADPFPLYEELVQSGASVGITAHNYPEYPEYRYIEKKNGKYCVQYNTFLKDEQGLKVLNWWCDSCIECCTENPDGEHYGDQKYIEQFEKRFNSIYEYKNPGIGMAPWNICKFYYSQEDKVIRERENDKTVKLYFYHFHGLNIIDRHIAEMKVLIRPGKHDKVLLTELYTRYLRHIAITEEKLNIDTKCIRDEKVLLRTRFQILQGFLMCEPNVIMLIRKLYRYLRYSRSDIIIY